MGFFFFLNLGPFLAVIFFLKKFRDLKQMLNLLIGWADPRCDANDGCEVRNFVIWTKEEREREIV